MTERAYRVRLLYRRDPRPPKPTAGYLPGGRFTHYLLNSMCLVFVLQVVIALARGEAAFLSLCFLTLAPLPLSALGFSITESRKPTKTESSSDAELRVRRRSGNGRRGREFSRLRIATEKGELGPRVEGEGQEGWITASGCLQADGAFFGWPRINAAEWVGASGDNVQLALTVGPARVKRFVACLLIALVTATLGSGSLVSIALIRSALQSYGLRMDLLAAVWLNLVMWLVCACFVRALPHYMRKPWRGGRLQVLFDPAVSTPESIEALLPKRLR